MPKKAKIPKLTDLIETSADTISADISQHQDSDCDDVSEVNFLSNSENNVDLPTNDDTSQAPISIDPFENNPAMEQVIKKILNQHMDMAWRKIKETIQREIAKAK